MGCLLSKCCSRWFGAKAGEFDPDNPIMIETRDSRSFDDDILAMHRTSIENQNAVNSNIVEAPMTTSTSTTTVAKPLNRRLNSDMTVEATVPMSVSMQSTETSPKVLTSTGSVKVKTSRHYCIMKNTLNESCY